MRKNETMMIVQNWLKSKYGNHHLFTINLTGRNNTIKGLIQALQIELSVIADGIWDKDTTNAFETLFPEGLSRENAIDINQKEVNIIYILQAGFYIARGISPGGLDGCFNEQLTTAIKTFQKQAGVIQDGIVRAYLFKGILSTDSYDLEKHGDVQIRTIQQNLNYKYYNSIELIPTNGIYDRRTNNALKKIVQIELEAISSEKMK